MTGPSQPAIQEESLRIDDKAYIQTEESDGRRVRKFLGEGAGRPLITDDPYESALGLMARSPQRRKPAQAMIDLVSKIEIYALDADFLRGSAATQQSLSYARKGTPLLAALLDAHRDPPRWKAVKSAITAIQPDLEDIEVRDVKPRGVILKYAGGRTSELGEESDGFVRAAGMFLIRYRPDCPAILGFDEPENGYHLSRLVDVVTRLAPGGSGALRGPEVLLLASHSAAMVGKAVRSLAHRAGVVGLWRSREGRVAVRSWSGSTLTDRRQFDAMVAEVFEGR